MYEKFPATDKRNFTLIVHNELAYRENMPCEKDVKSIDLLIDAKQTIETTQSWEMLGAIRLASRKENTWSAQRLRIAMNALQLVMEGWVILGQDNSEIRRIEQEGTITSFTDQDETTIAMILATFDEAIECLRKHHNS